MKKKEFLTEAKRKAIIADKEKAIIESFAKTFNKIKRLDENEVPTMDIKNAEKQAFEFAKSPEMGAFVNKILANAKPEEIEQLKRTIGSVSEGMMSENDFSSFLNIVHKAQSALMENNEVSDLQKSIGKALSTFGVVNIMSMGMLPSLVGMVVDHFTGTNFLQMASDAIGSGGAAAGLSVLGGLIGGGLIWRLGKAISGEKVTGDTPLFEMGIDEYGGEDYDLEARKQEYGINPEIEPNQFNDNDEVVAEMRFKDVASVYSANPPYDHIAAYKLKINDVDVDMDEDSLNSIYVDLDENAILLDDNDNEVESVVLPSNHYDAIVKAIEDDVRHNYEMGQDSDYYGFTGHEDDGDPYYDRHEKRDDY